MSDLRKAAEIALEALEEINKLSVGEKAICLPAEIDDAMEALRLALAQPKREWVGLTDAEVEAWRGNYDFFDSALVREVEAKLKEKNGG